MESDPDALTNLIPRACPQCGALLPGHAAAWLCPKCLLGQAAAVEGFPATAATPLGPGLLEQPGDQIGRYTLRQKIGEGGCGCVYLAEQEEPVRRQVALKVIKLGMDTRSVVARFEAERQALALMDHPNIAKVHDGGATETGRPFFVMELVPGTRLTDYCDQHGLSINQRLDLFIKVCQAIQHAHQKGIIHRDLKPSNILVTAPDGTPVPKVIDFGIAKATGERLTDKTLFTETGVFLGTPAYMSPEQVDAGTQDIDTRTDVYSLGVVLYELLSGKLPFDVRELQQAGIEEMCRIIREVEPPKPSTRLKQVRLAERGPAAKSEIENLKSKIDDDLDWIVMKCLEKDRNRRYETASALAADLQRHLNHEPVLATPPSGLYRFRKLVRRNKLAFGAAAGIALALIAGITVATWQAMRATQANRIATEARVKSDRERERAVAAEREQRHLRQQAEDASAAEAIHRRRAEGNERIASQEAAKSRHVARFMEEMFRSARPSIARGRDTGLLLDLADQAAARVDRELDRQPDVAAEIKASLADTYSELGATAKALPLLREALRLRHPDALTPVYNSESIAMRLGVLLEDLGRFREAEDVYRHALAVVVCHGGLDRPNIADLFFNIASIMENRAEWIGAEAMYRECIEIGRAHDRNAAKALNNLGNLRRSLGDWQGSLALYEEALAEARVHADGSTESTAEDKWPALVSMTRLLQSQGEFDRSEPSARAAFDLARQKFSHDPDRMAEAATRLAQVLEHQAKPAEAGSLWEEARRQYRQALASARQYATNSPEVIERCLRNLAGTLSPRGLHAEAEPLLRELVQSWRQRLRSSDREFWQGLALLGADLAQRAWAERFNSASLAEPGPPAAARAHEAERLLREAARLSDEIAVALGRSSTNAAPGDEVHGQWGEALVVLAATDTALSHSERLAKLTEAGPLITGAVESLVPDPTAGFRRRTEALKWLVHLRETWMALAPDPVQARQLAEARKQLEQLKPLPLPQGRSMPAEPDALYREALAARRRYVPKDRSRLHWCLMDLADCLARQGRTADAEPVYRQALALAREVWTNEPIHLTWSLTGLAAAVRRQGQPNEAETLFSEALALSRQTWSEPTEAILHDLGDVLVQQGKFAAAEPLLRELVAGRMRRRTADDAEVIEATTVLAGALSDWAWADRTSRDPAPAAARAREAERLLRSCLVAGTNAAVTSVLYRHHASNYLAGALISAAVTDASQPAEERLARFLEAETLLLRPANSNRFRTDDGLPYRFPARDRRLLECCVRLYEAWEAVFPNRDQLDKASPWRRTLADFNEIAPALKHPRSGTPPGTL